MGWVEKLKGSIVGLDTAPLIYYIELNPNFVSVIDPFFNAVEDGSFSVVTSTITLIETLVHPIRTNANQLISQYKALLLNSDGLSLIAIDPPIAVAAAELRAKYNLRTPDAIQVAAAINAGATYFLTNDATFKRVQEINILYLHDLK